MMSNLAYSIHFTHLLYIFYVSFSWLLYNENSYFQVLYHMKPLRNIVPNLSLLEFFTRNIKTSNVFSWTFISVGFFS